MDTNKEFRFLAEHLSKILGKGKITEIREKSMDTYDKGYSGAELIRIACTYEDGETTDFICKKAERKENMVMRRLTEQGHAYTPAAYAEDSASDAPQWMIQQDLGKRIAALPNDSEWMRNAAAAFAEIHGNNMARGEEMPWLPRADADYWNSIVTKISLLHFEKAVSEDINFARQFAPVLPKLQAAAKRFADDMTDLCKESEGMTLTHGDVQTINGSHVYNVGGHPYIIDFGFSRYAPFYIDLVDYFTLAEATFYREALADKGFCISKNDFEERFQIASKYPGYIYVSGHHALEKGR